MRLQVGFAFRRIEMALNYIVDNLSQFSGLAAQAERLDTLFAGEVYCLACRDFCAACCWHPAANGPPVCVRASGEADKQGQ